MDWKRLASRNDPVEQRRRELEERARNLQKQRAELEETLYTQQAATEKKETAPKEAVWRVRHEESFTRQHHAQTSQRPTRVLQAQRQKDRNMFMVLAGALVVLLFFLTRALLS